jgi:23S rRNA (uracil1939-C5)-methyltransferase
VTPGAFGQAHAGQEAALVDAVTRATARLLGDLRGKAVLELFAGAAAFGLELAARGARVTSVESFGPAAELAQAAASEQRLDLDVEIGDAVHVARTLREAGRRFDAVIVNPPRRGVSPTLRAEVAALATSTILYVSCEPVTLARDLDDFVRLGFSARTLAPYDMMPLTEEVETLAVLGPCSVPPPDVLYEDDAIVAVVKAPHEPVLPQGGGRSLLGRVRLLGGAERAVPVHSLDAGASGICLFARDPDDLADLARERGAAHREYTALIRGIARKKGSIAGSRGRGDREEPSRTRYVRAGISSGHSLVYVVPEKDDKHQIQRHLASIGHPVVGDRRFGDERTNVHFEARHFLDRPFLHLGFVRLERQGAPLELSSPLPPDLEHCLDGLEKRVTV